MMICTIVHKIRKITTNVNLRGHSFSTYAQRGGGSSKSVRHAFKGEGGLHVEVRTQKRPFLLVFCDIFICWKLLPCFVVIAVDSHYRFIKHLL